jgi:ubiquinone/menaquinone biosynthesis C-methylase UbiE
MGDFSLAQKLDRLGRLPHSATMADRTRKIYDRVSGIYPASTFFFHSRAHRCLLNDARIQDGTQILEVATGSGEMFRRLVAANPNGATYGLDLSPNMAHRTQKHARHKFPKASAYCQAVDVRHMPFRDESFDAVVCCYLLELLGTEDVRVTLKEIRRVLRKGGTLGMVLIGQKNPVYNRVYKLGGKIAPAFWGRQIEEHVTHMLENNALRIESDRCVTQSFYPSRILVARK